MSVIGSLDAQVARVLIASIEGKRDETNSPPQDTAHRIQERADAPADDGRSKPDDYSRDQQETLPVWLL